MYIVYLFRYGPMPHAGSWNLLVSILLTAAAWGAHASTEHAGYYGQSNDNTWGSVRGKPCHCVDMYWSQPCKANYYNISLCLYGLGEVRRDTGHTRHLAVRSPPPRPHVLPPPPPSVLHLINITPGWHLVSGNPTLFRDRICLPASF